MSGGGGGNQTTKTELPDYAQPAAKEILRRGTELSNQPIPQYGGKLVADLSAGQQAGINGINKLAGQTNPTLNAANTAVTNVANNASNPYTASNPYIGQNVQASQNPYATMQNPYLDAQVNKAQTDMVNQYKSGTSAQTMAQFRNSGAFGGSAMQETQDQQNNQLVNGLTNVETQMRGNAYASTQAAAGQQAALNTQTALTNQTNNLNATQAQNALNSQNHQNAQSNGLMAGQIAPNLNAAGYFGFGQQMQAGQVAQNQQQNQLGALYQKWYNRAFAPHQQLGILQNAMHGALGNGTQGSTTMSQSGGGGLTGALGGAASGAAMGSFAGPWGTAIGAGVGGLMGAFSK